MGTEMYVRTYVTVRRSRYVRVRTYVRCPREALRWHSGGLQVALGGHSRGSNVAVVGVCVKPSIWKHYAYVGEYVRTYVRTWHTVWSSRAPSPPSTV